MDGKASVLGSGVERRFQAHQRASPQVSHLYLVRLHSTEDECLAQGLRARFARCALEIGSPACFDVDGHEGRGGRAVPTTAIFDVVPSRSYGNPVGGDPDQHKLPDARRCHGDHGVQ